MTPLLRHSPYQLGSFENNSTYTRTMFENYTPSLILQHVRRFFNRVQNINNKMRQFK